MNAIDEQVQGYIDGVLSGEIVTGRLVRLAVERHVYDLKHAAKRGYRFSEDRAREAINFFPECCRHSIGRWADKPFELSPWQMFVVWCVFGWLQVSDGMRRFRKAFISIARKNGKSTFCSGLALLLLTFDNPVEAGAEIYVAATKEEQACIIHREAARMVSKSPSLRRIAKVFQKNITVPHNDSYLRPLGSDSDKTDGLNPHGVFKDELHAWRKHHRGLHEKLSTGGASRDQPLEVTITTAGDDQSVIWLEELAFARKVLEAGITEDPVSDTLFAFVASLDYEERPCVDCQDEDCTRCDGSGTIPKDDPFDERTWPKANPNLGVSVRIEYLRDQANDARNKPTSLNSFLRYHCNVMTTSTQKAVVKELWDACSHQQPDLRGKPCFGAWDLGRTDDFAGIALTFPIETGESDKDGKPICFYEAKAWAFTCEDRGDDLLKDSRIQRWIDQRLLEVHPGRDIDFGVVQERILEIHETYYPQQWVFDPTFSQQMAQELLNKHGVPVEKFTQSPKMYNEPLRSLLKALRERRFGHDGNPVLAWCADNLAIVKNARDEWMPDKASSLGKIDPMVALLMAFGVSIWTPAEEGFWDPSEGVYL